MALALEQTDHHPGQPQQPQLDLSPSLLQGADIDREAALRLYYARLFPFKRFHIWLSYQNLGSAYFSRREFSFTLANDVYLRFLSFATETDFAEKVAKLCPAKIDIGAVYNARPSEKKSMSSSSFKPVERELVFDIDMTDYDDVRTCCQDKSICEKCWVFISVAVRVVHRALTEDFGYKNILWVFSGRRGAHCWVADERARKLDGSARKLLVAYLEVLKAGHELKKKIHINGDTVHPHIRKSAAIARRYFSENLVTTQDWLMNKASLEKLLSLVPDEGLKGRVLAGVERFSDPQDRWNYLAGEISAHRPTGKTVHGKALPSQQHWLDEVVLQYCYPRLDVNVSIGLNHLLKSPFCVHPDTGNVSVPFDPEQVEAFSPLTCPKVQQIAMELLTYDATHAGEPREALSDYKKTSLRPYIQIFDKFLESIKLDLSARAASSSPAQPLASRDISF